MCLSTYTAQKVKPQITRALVSMLPAFSLQSTVLAARANAAKR